MIELDNPQAVFLGIIFVVFLAPFLYSFVIDNFDKSDKTDK